MRNLKGKSRKEDVTRNAFQMLEGLHLPRVLQKVCADMNLKDATIRSTKSQIDALLTEQWVSFHLDNPDDKVCVNFTASVREDSRTHPPFLHIYTAADAEIRAEVAALGTLQLKMGLGNWSYWEDFKIFKYRSLWLKWKPLTRAPLWRTANKRAPPSPQTLSVRKQLQTKAEAPASAPTTQTQLSTSQVINISKQNNQETKCSLTTCCIGEIKKTPAARSQDVQHRLWVVNADLLAEYDSARFVPRWSLDVMILGMDVIFYNDTDVVYRIGRDMQRLGRIEKEKDSTTVPFYHARLPVYTRRSGSVTTNMYQLDQHIMSIETTSR